MNIYFVNDTSSYHAGSAAVVQNIRQLLSDHTILAADDRIIDRAALRKCDAVVVNGEGTIHHDRPHASRLIETLRSAQELGKRTYLVNALLQDMTNCESVIRSLDFLAVRGPLSYEYAESIGGNPHLYADMCVNNIISPPPFERVGIAVGDVHSDTGYNWIHNLPYERISLDGSFQDAVDRLSRVELYITGQHHGMYAAGLADTPIIAIPSNSWKIEGLISWSGLPIPVCRSRDAVLEAVEAMDYDLGPGFGEWLRGLPRLESLPL